MVMVHIDKMSSSSRKWVLAQGLYDKNVELENKRRRSAQARVPSDPNAWQQMRENYEAIILEDHNFSEQHNIEYALWQLQYRRIEEFRAPLSAALASSGSTTSQGGRVPNRLDRITKIRLQFKMFLSEATGFYHDLILKIRAKYGLPLGDFEDSDGESSIETKKGLISCHRCLIYLGDLARYKRLYGEGGDSKSRDYAAASSYYLQAASLWPPSGNPHHQLAILATYSGDEFVAVYRYFRSLAVDSPFSTAKDNLIVAFEKNRQSYSLLEEDAKSSATKEISTGAPVKGRGKAEVKVRPKVRHESFKAFCVRFVRLNGILFTRTSLETSVEVLSVVSGALHELLSSGQEEDLNFGIDATENGLFIVRLIAVLIFAVHNVSREAEEQTYTDIVQHNVLLQKTLTAVFELMGLILKRCIELYEPSSSYLMPGILIFVEWLACCANAAAGCDAEDKQATVRTTFWNRCILLLNKLLSTGLECVDDEDETCFFNMSRYEEGETENRLALWEDFELRGFTPLQPAQTILNFSRKHSFGGDHNKEKLARVKRILVAGKALADVVKVDHKEFRFDSKLKKFVLGVELLASDDFKLTPYSGGPKLMSKIQDTHFAVVLPKAQLDVEGEEDDEEIVFKPIVTEKRDLIGLKRTHNEGSEASQNAFGGDSQFYGSSVSGPHFRSQLPLSVAKIAPQNMHSIESHSSLSLVNQLPSLANGLKGLRILENGHVMKPGIRDVSTQFTASISSSTKHSGGVNVNDVFYGQEKVLENVIQPNIDVISSSGVNSRTSSVLAASSRKSPVHRPERHLGPPPGFRSVPPKQVNVPTSALDVWGENPLIDDYSWLDGYQLPSSMRNLELNQIINQSSHLSRQHISNENGSTEPINFPFPGKQVPSMQLQVETQKGWQDHQTLERINLNHEHLLQPQGSEQFPVADQYQGQSTWAGCRFV